MLCKMIAMIGTWRMAILGAAYSSTNGGSRSSFVNRFALGTIFIILAGIANAGPGVYKVEPGTRIVLANGTVLALECNDFTVQGTFLVGGGDVNNIRDVTISGQLNGGSGVLDVGGNWTNNGQFDPGNGQVLLDGFCRPGQVVVVKGTTNFNRLNLAGTGVTYAFPPGNAITVLTSLNLGNGNRLESSGSEKAIITLGPNATVSGDQTLINVEIRQPTPTPTSIPTLGNTALILLILLLLGLVAHHNRLVPLFSRRNT